MTMQFHSPVAGSVADTEVTIPEEATPVLRLRRERTPVSRGPVKPLRHRWYVRAKVAVDFVLAALLAVPALPLVALAALVCGIFVKDTPRGAARSAPVDVALH